MTTKEKKLPPNFSSPFCLCWKTLNQTFELILAKITVLPGSHGAEKAVASSARGPGFDPSNIQMYFSSNGCDVVGRKMELEVKNGRIKNVSCPVI